MVDIDARTFRTSTPGDSVADASGRDAQRSGTGVPWGLVAALSGVGALAAAGVLSLALRRRRQRLALGF